MKKIIAAIVLGVGVLVSAPAAAHADCGGNCFVAIDGGTGIMTPEGRFVYDASGDMVQTDTQSGAFPTAIIRYRIHADITYSAEGSTLSGSGIVEIFDDFTNDLMYSFVVDASGATSSRGTAFAFSSEPIDGEPLPRLTGTWAPFRGNGYLGSMTLATSS